MAKAYVKPIDEAVLRRLANIFGPHSASALALADAEARRRLGETIAFYEWHERGQTYTVVGPAITDSLEDPS
jgi:hypothetical protein